MANSNTLVSTGVALDVLVSIRNIQFQSCLVAIPMMEGLDLIFGKDWMDMINPLVDWRINTIFIKYGGELHRMLGLPVVIVNPCGIKDRELSNL